MSWFSVLKIKTRKRHVRDMYRKVRTVARPIVNDLIEKYASDKNDISVDELRELIQREIIDSKVLHNHTGLADIPGEEVNEVAARSGGPRHRYIISSAGHFLKMATYKLRQMGFERKQKNVSGITVSYYSRGD